MLHINDLQNNKGKLGLGSWIGRLSEIEKRKEDCETEQYSGALMRCQRKIFSEIRVKPVV